MPCLYAYYQQYPQYLLYKALLGKRYFHLVGQNNAGDLFGYSNFIVYFTSILCKKIIEMIGNHRDRGQSHSV